MIGMYTGGYFILKEIEIVAFVIFLSTYLLFQVPLANVFSYLIPSLR